MPATYNHVLFYKAVLNGFALDNVRTTNEISVIFVLVNVIAVIENVTVVIAKKPFQAIVNDISNIYNVNNDISTKFRKILWYY